MHIGHTKGLKGSHQHLGLHGIVTNLLDLKVFAAPFGDLALGQERKAIVEVTVLALNKRILLQVLQAAMHIFLFAGQW